MKDKIQLINPITYPGWDEMLLSSPNYSFFHSSAWAEVLYKSYGYTPFYFTVFGGKWFSALLPMMEVKSFLTGRRGVSLPFTDYCDPISNGTTSFSEMLVQATEFGRKRGWRSFELRGGHALMPKVLESETYFGHTLELSDNEEDIFSKFRGSTKRNIRKALAQGIQAVVSTSLESVDQFYRLNSLTRRRHGLPPQPYSFFKNLHERILSRDMGFVVLAFLGKEAVAGAVCLHFGNAAVYKFGASEMKYQHLRPNNLVMWEAIKSYCRKGFKRFSFGRTEVDNHGLVRFKSGWGTTEYQINYYRYDLKKEAFIVDSSKVTGFHNKILNKMPIPILNRIGNILYRHVG